MVEQGRQALRDGVGLPGGSALYRLVSKLASFVATRLNTISADGLLEFFFERYDIVERVAVGTSWSWIVGWIPLLSNPHSRPHEPRQRSEPSRSCSPLRRAWTRPFRPPRAWRWRGGTGREGSMASCAIPLTMKWP